MSESDVKLVAENYASQNGIGQDIERVSFVDVECLPERLRLKGSFWVVTFEPPEQLDVVIENAGVVLNISDSDQSVSVVE